MKSALQAHQRTGTPSEHSEGRARLPLIPRGVFYNPRMNLGRDFAVLFSASFFPEGKRLCVCDAMTGSGVRAVRYMLEAPNVARVVAADKSPEAVEAAKRTIRLNSLEKAVAVVESDANLLLLEHMQERFDLVDLDPFGSPAPYLESALRAIADGGILAATATDMGPLTGARPAACFRKYGARTIRTEFEKEMAVRIIAGCLGAIAGRLELGVEVVFAHASDHYARIYAALRKGKAFANQSAKQLGFLEYCPKCLMRNSADSLGSIEMVCKCCGTQVEIGGPIWLGRLWDGGVVQRMVQRTPTLSSMRLSEIQMILSRIIEEADNSAFYYRTDAFARSLKIE
ncbi:MAG: methyltransferase domain-containing protein, partial [Candidatus Bathyarchaeia archaeon]